jgi:hypothetical protein
VRLTSCYLLSPPQYNIDLWAIDRTIALAEAAKPGWLGTYNGRTVRTQAAGLCGLGQCQSENMTTDAEPLAAAADGGGGPHR